MFPIKHAAAAKSLQSCLTLCDPMDCSLPGSSVHGIFQARVLEWGAITFSELSMKILERNKFDIAFGQNQLAFKFSLNFQVARVLKMARVGKYFLHFFNLFFFFCLIHLIQVVVNLFGVIDHFQVGCKFPFNMCV